MQEIASKENQFIKLASKLHNKKTRDELNLFIIEGKTLIKEALNKNQKIKHIFFFDEDFYSEIEDTLDPNIDCFSIDESLMSKIAATENPPPVLAIVEKTQKAQKLNGNFFVFCEDLQDPGNLGSIVRSSFASGVNKIFLSPNSCDIYNPKTLRSSVGTIFYGDIEYKTLEQLIEELNQYSKTKNSKLEILGTSSHAENDIFKTEFKKEDIHLVLIGSEAEGLSQEAIDSCNKLIKIPLYNGVESINVLAASSIVLFEINRSLTA